MRKDAQQNRAKILATAAQLFREQSVAAVSMKAIATAAGIGPGTLYRNYPNKSALCLDMSMTFIQEFVADAQQYLYQTTDDAVTQFKQVLTRYLRFRERRLQLLASIENGATVMPAYYKSDLYHELIQLFMQVLKPVSGPLLPGELKFRADMLIAMLKSNSYAYQREQGLSRDDLLTQISRLMIKSADPLKK
ncbi:TetR/AcrR family transcriptional regulator [Lactiplantibacillus daowaiensis]|uniref:TetR/AcrR family transcriptional regulator n=1 Tax=Lactiplantibacillus daowaiensis TaxID=2559918 RepID=A0ABW1S0X3_9LACO|nr:TetR/AcrR family transcriptional regulator [Lactiplantibacillus daowaiensis]